jgi:hypothetical protein
LQAPAAQQQVRAPSWQQQVQQWLLQALLLLELPP